MRVGVVTCDHEFTCDKINPSVIICMNTGLLLHKQFYSGGLEGTDTIYFHLHDTVFEASYVFTHTYRMILEIEECAESSMWEFHGRHIASGSSGNDNVSLCSSIYKNPNKISHVDGAYNPILHYSENRSKDKHVLFLL